MKNIKNNKCKRKLMLVIPCLIIAAFLSFFIFPFSSAAVECQIEGDHIVIGEIPYSITDIDTLVDADLALLRWRSSGSAEAIHGKLGGVYLEGFEAVYNKVYDMLLEYATSTVANGAALAPTSVTETLVVKLEQNATATISTTARTINGGGRLIIVAENKATMKMTAETAKFTVGNSNGTGTLVIQGRDQNNNITFTSDSKIEKTVDAITVNNGSLYLQYCDLNGFTFVNKSMILFSQGNYARYLYMSDSSMQNITGNTSESGGIMCQVFGGKSDLADDSQLFINHSLFDTCKALNNNKAGTIGGAAIRSYAADMCELLVQNTKFNNNLTGNETSNGSGTGGGAIYWKSVNAKATLKNCTFTNNRSNAVGGAILNMGKMEIIKCHFENNYALQNGGAIAVEPPYTTSGYETITGTSSENKQNNLSGTLTLDSETKLINNQAGGNGGGIYFNAATGQISSSFKITKYEMKLTIDGAEIRGNKAGGNGGAIGFYLNYGTYNYATGVKIEGDSIIAENTAQTNGGAIWINSASGCDCKGNIGVTMDSGTLTQNVAKNGGAIYIETGKANAQINFTINGGTISNNTASQNGGAAYIKGGSVIMKQATITDCTATANGGTIYIGDGSFDMSGGSITKSRAYQNGGAVYVSGGDAIMSGGYITFSKSDTNGGAICMTAGSVSVSGTATISNCEANNGGAAYLGGGTMKVSGGSIKDNTAYLNGGGAYLAGGEFVMSDGSILANKAVNGAGAFIANGDVAVSGGTISNNVATNNGGAFSIMNGNYSMIGGMITLNKATNGDGGAIYVSSSKKNTNIIIRSGSVTNNEAGRNGGALGVYGQDGVEFTITVGSCTSHDGNFNNHVCADNNAEVEACPVIKSNISGISGGGIYLAGSYAAVMNMYCLVEGDNKVGDGVSYSNFLKVEGGTLNITSLDENGNDGYGNVVIYSSMHVTGGKVTISGKMTNPMFADSVTVDISGDSEFTDKRVGDGSRTIQYFENFEKNGKISGRYTLIDAPLNEAHIVRANMYFNVGYEVEGWILMTKDSEGNLVPSGTIYNAGDEAPGEDNLIFYAKWVTVGYTVVFTPGVDSYKGEMAPQDFAYSDQKALTANAFINVGYTFVHWVDANNNQKTYSDGQTVSELSETHGTTITLVAVWKICDHSNMSDYTIDTTDTSATRQCGCLGYTETASLSSVTVVYDGHAHGTAVTYQRETLNGLEPSEKWNFNVLYNGTTNADKKLTNSTTAPTDAGRYTGSIKINENVVSVDIVIERANRTEAPAAPEYSTTEDGGYNIIEVQKPNTLQYPIEYQFSWYEGTELKRSGWIVWEDGAPPKQKLEITYTNYYVDVRYAQTPNYNASSIVRGTSVIVWTGDVTFKISSGEGLSYSYVTSDQQEGITVTLTPLEGYYIYKIDHTVSDVPDYVPPQIDHIEKSSNLWKAQIHEINAANQGESVTIEISFSGAERIATVISSSVKNEVFDSIETKGEDQVTISRDSAFTAYFKVEHYKHYENPSISFGNALPAKSTIIMIDQSDGSYWSYTTLADESSIELSRFVRMGTENGYYVAEGKEQLSLQLIVDFSDCTIPPQNEELNISFSGTPVQQDNLQTVPDLPNVYSEIKLVDKPTFSINKVGSLESEYSQSISYQFGLNSGTNIGASKWEGICCILCIKPTDATATELPADIRLQVKIGDSTEIYPLVNGKFTVALPSLSDRASLTLLSDMMPNKDLQLIFNVQLWVSNTMAKTTPSILLTTENVELTYTVSKTVIPAIHAAIIDELPKYDGSGVSDLYFRVYIQSLPSNYTVKAVLYGKNANGGYTSTTQTMTIPIVDNQLDCSLDLNSFKEGMSQTVGSLSLMLRIEVLDTNGKVVEFVPLYFVLIDTRQ